jgi:hypothetical protein
MTTKHSALYSWFSCNNDDRTHLFVSSPGSLPVVVECPQCGGPLGTLLTAGPVPVPLGSARGAMRPGSTYDSLVLPAPLYEAVKAVGGAGAPDFSLRQSSPREEH